MQPSLHEYSIFAMKMKLNNEYSIAFPIAVCEPLVSRGIVKYQ